MDSKLVFVFLSLISCSFASIVLNQLPMQDDITIPTTEAPETPVPTTKPTTTVLPPSPPTTPKSTVPPKTTTQTPPPSPNTTTTVTPTPPTTTPPTTTTTPNTTTVTPPPTPNTTTTETPPPTTSTVAPPTTVAPPPAVLPSKWYVKDGNVTCVVAQAIVSLNISYVDIYNKTQLVTVDVTGSPNGTAVLGTCGNETQSLTLNFGDNHNLTVTFNKTAKTDYKVSLIQLQVNATALPNSTGGVLTYSENGTLFNTPLAMSYKCAKVQNVNLTSSANMTATLSLKDTQLQAFRSIPEVGFGNAADCDNSVPDIVPIAVGCALTALVLVVLVAYLIGRRRSTTTGYVSM